jgi:hypothetical protein
MNLTDMANHVCAKVRKTDTDSVSVCKDFVNRGYENLWNEQLWRESLGLTAVSVTPATDALHAAGQVLMPRRSMSSVIAVRSAQRALAVAHYEELLAYDTDLFDQSGDPAGFVLMRPVVHAFADATSVLSGYDTTTSDDGIEINFEYLNADNEIVIGHQHFIHTEPLNLNYGSTPLANLYAREYYSITKPKGNGTVIFYLPGGAFFHQLQAFETAVPLRQRIRLLDKPSAALTLTVLGKREFVPLADYDSPVLSWSSNCLMDFAQADMLERDRQYAKAASKRAEAVALLDRARRVEVFQQAFNQRLIPAAENGDFGGDLSSKGYW